MQVTIKTLTPLWTGGVEAGKCDRIHETGILGSLRWWMEVLVRGMGGNVCDPTSENRSGFDPKKFDAKVYRQFQTEAERHQYLRDAELCDVSQIFGATGWKRRFRLEIQEIKISDATVRHPIKANRSYTDNKGNSKTPTWYFPDPTQKDVKPQAPNTPKTGTFIIQIQSLHPDFKPEVIGGLIQFIADWSALGARPQMGFGVIQVEGSHINTQPLYEWLITTSGSDTYPNLPSLQNIFLAKIQPKDLNPTFREQDTFNLKYDLRNCFKVQPGKPDNLLQLRHFIMGAAPDDKKDGKTEDKSMAAKVKISRPYKDKQGNEYMRVWGWIPETAKVRSKDGQEKDLYTNAWSREEIVKKIHKHLKDHYTFQVWREMKSDSDTEAKNIADAKVFLHSLLKLQESDHDS